MDRYCVVLCLRPFESERTSSRMKRCYVESTSAALAVLTASDLNPQYTPIGVEPIDLPACA